MKDSIAVILKKKRNSMKISQIELSAASEISINCIARMETDRKQPDLTEIRKLCKAFKCSASELLGF